jgi:hypothetical protein
MDFIVMESSFIVTAVFKLQDPLSRFHPSLILTLICLPIRPLFNPIAMLAIIEPLTFISCSVSMLIETFSLGLIFEPISLILISSRMN